jgi:hypothetical protein
MHKFTTKDGKILSFKSNDQEVIRVLENTIPRLTYDEILDGELEKRLESFDIDELKLSDKSDIKTLILSLAMFNNLSKPGSV